MALAASAISASLLTGCAGSTDRADAGLIRADVAARAVSTADAAALPDVVAASREAGMALLAAAADDANTVVSPSSLQVALSMLSEGARGDSLAQLEATLGATGDDRRDAFAALRGALAPLDGDPRDATGDDLPDEPIVHVADQVVVYEGLDVRDDYLATVAEVYDAGIHHIDLEDAAAKDVLDAWADHHTGGLIPESAIKSTPGLRLVLQDAALLAARWQTSFDMTDTFAQPFTLPGGDRADVDMMHSSESFAYAEVDGWRAARLPYDEALHADVVLPPAGVDPATASADVLAELDAVLDAAAPEPIDLALPKIDTASKLDLLPSLEALGVASIACGSGGADLSGIGGAPGELCVAEAAQQTVLRVNEQGTVAAAITEIGVGESAAPAVPDRQLHLDRPFLFHIAHTDTDWLMFAAAIRDPRS